MSEHKNHRQRLKQRLRQAGLDHFSDVQFLELLLCYTIPRKDTNPIAHALLEQFGSVSQVLEAPLEALEKVEGVGPESALLLHLLPQAFRFYQVDKNKKILSLTTLEKCGEYLVGHFQGRRNENVFLLCLDAKCRVLCCRQLTEGGVNNANLSVRKVVETALAVGATSVVVAHNHPSGIALPSGEDLQATRRLAAALRAVDVTLADHIVVSDGDYVSMVQSGYVFEDLQLV